MSAPPNFGFVEYVDGEVICEGYFHHCAKAGEKRPCVLVAHDWVGQTEAVREGLAPFAESGFVAFAMDVYGKGVRGDPSADNSALMAPYLADRAKLRRRLLAAVEAAKRQEGVDPERLAVIGYCFGGLCALDVARSGAKGVKAVASIHGLFTPPGLRPQGPISAKVLALHGWDDPMVKPEGVKALADELDAAKADWQIHAFGHTMHAFTSKGANNPSAGLLYSQAADRRSRAILADFLAEALG
ncbi:MAG: dienelactone hydrolase family protein [Caulobacteraceae bacterium]